MLYEGITGRVPFESESLASLLVKIATTLPVPIRELRPEVPELLSDCIAQAMAHHREDRFADAVSFRKALTRAAERSFGATKHGIMSEGPVEHLPLEQPANLQEAQLAAAANGWGGFAELESRSRVAAPRASAPQASAPRMAAPQGGRVAASQPVRSSHAQAEAIEIQTTHDEMLFGDNPLDTFAGEAGRLELDVKGPTFPRVAGVASPPANQTSRRPDAPAPAARGRGSSSTPSAAFWLLPVVLALGFVVLVFAPSLFSLPLPDAAAVQKREAESPATRDGKAYREIGPRPKLGPIAPALRDVTF
jgi:hypothetical protein